MITNPPTSVLYRLFLKDPQYPLREPLKFGQGLAEALVACLTNTLLPAHTSTHSSHTNTGTTSNDLMNAPASEQALLYSACAVALLKHNPLVGDTLAAQGYVPRLLTLLAQRLPPAAVTAAEEPPAAPIVQVGGLYSRRCNSGVRMERFAPKPAVRVNGRTPCEPWQANDAEDV